MGTVYANSHLLEFCLQFHITVSIAQGWSDAEWCWYTGSNHEGLLAAPHGQPPVFAILVLGLFSKWRSYNRTYLWENRAPSSLPAIAGASTPASAQHTALPSLRVPMHGWDGDCLPKMCLEEGSQHTQSQGLLV